MPDRDDLGGVQGWVASIIDVTDRKQAEAASRRLTAIVESSDDAIIGKDLEDAVTSWNKAAERIFGYTAAEILGQPTTILYPPGLGHAAAGNLKEVSEGETIGQHEVVCRRKDGRLIDVSLTISPLKDAAGRVIGVSKIARDVTERKRAQEALEHAQAQLKAHADELEKTVLERTAELRERNAELEAFSYSLSHDLRAPLRTISNFTEFTLEDCRDKLGSHATNLERVLSASRRMDRLVIDVLAFTRVSWQEIKVETVDVESLVRAIINERPDFQAPAAEIEIKSPLPPIKGHPASLTQCVTNLLGNAVKFVAKDVVPRIVIRSEITAEIVRLWFEDNGVGIDKAAQPVIFDMFRRAHNKPQYEGSGLGLAIVRKAIERMGGKVGVESEPGKGSRFWIELPKG
jgi:PAS domain S-box-containing protein